MSRFILYSLIVILLLTACQPGDIPPGIPVKPVMTLIPDLITEPPVTLTELPTVPRAESTSVLGTTPIASLPPLSLDPDPGASTSGGFQAYRLIVSLAAWETPNPELVRLHLPPNAALTEISASGWTCERVAAQEDIQPADHTDIRCQSLTMGRSVQPLIIVWFTLPLAADGDKACAEIAIKDIFSTPVCVTSSF